MGIWLGYGCEPSYDLELDGDKWEIEDTLVFYVDNPRLNDLSLTITVEFENDVDVLETSYSNRSRRLPIE